MELELLYLTQNNSQELNLSSDGFTDAYEMNFVNNLGKDLQIVRSVVDNVGQPLITFEISNDGINWSSWNVEGFIFKDLNNIFIFNQTKHTLFRVKWLSNSSTGTFTANFNISSIN